MKTTSLPTLKELQQAFIYNPTTGEMTNKQTRRKYQKRRYQRLTLNGVKYLAHRVAYKMMTGLEPVGVIDHINNDATDNRWENLQDISPAENALKDRQLIHACVYPPNTFTRSKKWVARIQRDGVKHYLGSFESKEQAQSVLRLWLEQNT